MNKIFLAICLIATSLTTFAQYNEGNYPPVTFGITGGVNVAFLNAKIPQGSTVANNPVYAGSFGVNADLRFNDYLSIRPGVSYSGKGGDIQYSKSFTVTGFGSIDQIIEQKFSFNYLEIPVNVIGHIPMSDNFNILIGTGPYAAFNLNGKITSTVGGSDPQTNKATFGKNGEFKSTDFGISSILGFETTSGIIFGINYDMGFTNIIQNGGSNNSLKWGSVYASLGFTLK